MFSNKTIKICRPAGLERSFLCVEAFPVAADGTVIGAPAQLRICNFPSQKLMHGKLYKYLSCSRGSWAATSCKPSPCTVNKSINMYAVRRLSWSHVLSLGKPIEPASHGVRATQHSTRCLFPVGPSQSALLQGYHCA